MSIIWLEPFTFFKPDSNIFYFQSLNLIIYLNMISCISFIVYSMLYNMDKYMQKPPSTFTYNLDTLIIFKMFGECMVSLTLLILFLCYSFENNKRQMNKTDTLVYILSLFSPCAVFLAYFFNICLAHNLYQTFYAYKNVYEKRLAVYKLIALVVSIAIIVFSLLFNSTIVNSKFTLAYYKIYFLAFFYVLGAFLIIYMIQIILYVITKKDELFTYDDSESDKRNQLLSIFVNRNVYYLIVFILCYAPNNIIQLIQIFSPERICEECPGLSISVYLASLSCFFSFCLKFTEPYMMKYLHLIKNFVLRKKEENKEANKDISEVYVNNDNLIENGTIELKNVNQESNSSRLRTENSIGDMVHTFKILNDAKECSDHISRLAAICMSLNEDTGNEYEKEFSKVVKDLVPWEIKLYKHKTEKKLYTVKDFPDWLPRTDEKFKKFKVKLRKYSGMVFNHFKKIDGISIKEMIESLHPIKNISKINESIASGGRSQNPIIFTWDKKFLMKTISKEEKDIFLAMLPEYHKRMKDAKSFLCRIYGLFRIMVNDKESTHIILMRNMCELSSDSKILTFDLKGSTEGRTGFNDEDLRLLKLGKRDQVIMRNCKEVLKDNDFSSLNMKFRLSKKDANRMDKWVTNDAELLKGNNITDYSLLVTIHSFNKEDYERNKTNYRVFKSFDNLHLYNFSLIDFFCNYGVIKKGEHKYKRKILRQENISVQEPTDYFRRLVKHVQNCIEEEKDSIKLN